MFKPNDYLKKALDNKNVVRIRSAFTVIAHEDPSFSTGKFNETLEYVKKENIHGVFSPFDGKEFQPKENWNEEYWALIVSTLVDNFCMERINHLKEVSKVLYPQKVNEKLSTSTSNYNINQNKKLKDDKTSKKAIPMAVTAGLAVTCVTAMAIEKKGIAVITGLATIVTGIYTAFKQ